MIVYGSVRIYNEMLCGFNRVDVRPDEQELTIVFFLLIFNHRLNSVAVIAMACVFITVGDVKQSFSNPRYLFNNFVMESFFKSMKTEKLYRTDFRSEREFRIAVKEYIEFYNEKQPHSVFRIEYLAASKRITSRSKPLCRIFNSTRMVRLKTILKIHLVFSIVFGKVYD